MSKHIIIYSHGFGVLKDDRGLFTDIAGDLAGIDHVMFDYNEVDTGSNTLTVTPLDKQAKMLAEKYEEVRSNNPTATIDLICHSQGCVVAAIAKLQGIRKTIFLAPPSQFLGAEAKIKQMSERPGTAIKDGIVSYPRRDGSTTIIKSDYWESRDKIQNPIELYNALSGNTELTIINASQDEVLGETDFSNISLQIKVVALDGNHDFTDASRVNLKKEVQTLIADSKLSEFTKESVHFVETMQVKEGVECDVYEFIDDISKDLAIVRVKKGFKTPLQRIMLGDRTVEGFVSGTGTLTVKDSDEKSQSYSFSGSEKGEVEVSVGQIMQWYADGEDDLTFYEICWPPYEDGRFENLVEGAM